MATVFLINIEGAVADSLRSALAVQKHRIESKPVDAPVNEFLEADIVFASADDERYLALLRRLRQIRPYLPFIVVTEIPNVSAWLAAMDAGASDYCSAPFSLTEISSLMESGPPGRQPHAEPARSGEPCGKRGG